MLTNRGMFKLLYTHTPVQEAIAGTYYALRLIRHRTELSSLEQGRFVEEAPSEPSAGERSLGLSIVREIEDAEQVTLSKLNERRAQFYLRQLSNILEERAGSTFKHNSKRGKELLAELYISSL